MAQNAMWESCVTLWNTVDALLSNPGLRVAFLWGPPSVGKTYAAQRVGLNGRTAFSFTCTQETPAIDLLGCYQIKGGDSVWVDGPMTLAARSGGRCVVNEVSRASDDVQSMLYGITESSRTASLTLANGEVLTPSDGFQVFITDNAGPEGLPEALQSRFDIKLAIDKPSVEALATFPESMHESILATLLVADLSRRCTLREWDAYFRLAQHAARETHPLIATGVFGEAKGEMIADALAAHAIIAHTAK